MNTENCLYCKDVFEGMKGKLLIKVNSPKNLDCDFPIEIKEVNNKFGLELFTNSVYIYDLKEELCIYASMPFGRQAESEFVRVSPDEFTHVEINYDYQMIKNEYRIKKLRLDVIEHINEVRY